VRDAGRSDEHVDAAQLAHRSGDHRVVVGRVRGVDPRERSTPTHRLDLGDRLRAMLFEDVGDDHVGAFVGQAETARAPDAVAAAGDDRDLSLETSHLAGSATRATSGW
jgi:hypothetical protein